MKAVFKAHRTQLIVLIILFIPIMLFSLVPVKYTAIAPGYNNSVSEFISIEDGYEFEGSIHTTSVIVLEEMLALQYFVGQHLDTVSINEQPSYYDSIDMDDLRVSGFIAKDISVSTSLIYAGIVAGRDIDFEAGYMVTMTYTYLDTDTLQLGDVVVSINGNTDIIDEVENVACDTSATFSILREDEPLSIDVTKHDLGNDVCRFGISLSSYTEINSIDIDYVYHNNNTSGPSGGLMQALYVYNSISPHDITGGYKVAGTGTLDIEGSVGQIGGIKQKIITSVINNVDIFFVPTTGDETDNYHIAQQVLEELDSDMILIPVSTFEEAVAYLEGRFGGAFSE